MDTTNRAMDTYGPEDMAIPEIKLVQNVGGTDAKQAGAEPGDFYCNITGEVFKGVDGFEIVVVDIKKTRTYWGRTEIDDEPPVCASADAIVNMQGERCEACPYQARCDTPWLLAAAERRTKCLLNYAVLAILVKSQIPVLLRASGISTQPVRELMTSLRLNKRLRGEYHKAVIRVVSQQKKTSAGDAFAMSFRPTGLVGDEAQVEELRTQSAQLLGTVTLLPEGITPENETNAGNGETNAPQGETNAPQGESFARQYDTLFPSAESQADVDFDALRSAAAKPQAPAPQVPVAPEPSQEPQVPTDYDF